MLSTKTPVKLRTKPVVKKQKLLLTYTLPAAATTSAGIYSPDGKRLLRTLWNNKRKDAGTFRAVWDGKDDEGNLIANGSACIWRLIYNNVRYDWQGVVGNTSLDLTGEGKWNNAQNLSGLAFWQNFGLTANSYEEGKQNCYNKFELSNPNVRLNVGAKLHHEHTVGYVVTDRTASYYAGGHAPLNLACMVTCLELMAGEVDREWATSTLLNNMFWAIDLEPFYGTDSPNYATGLAVQQDGNFLFVAHKSEVRVFDKRVSGGAELRAWPADDIRHIVLTDDNTMWAITGSDNVIRKFTLDAQGVGTDTGVPARGPIDPISLAFDRTKNVLSAADGSRINDCKTTGRHQVWDFNATTGERIGQLFGDTEGYSVNPRVTDTKWGFINAKSFEQVDPGQAQPYIAYQPDGSLWVGDLMNCRNLRFTADRQYLDQLSWTGYHYSAAADRNAPSAVFNDYREYEVDYSDPTKLVWKLVRNYSAGYGGLTRMTGFDNPYSRMENILTFPSGRRYALAQNRNYSNAAQVMQIVEVPKDGPMIFTDRYLPHFNCRWGEDGSLWIMNGFGNLGISSSYDRCPLLSDPTTPGQYPEWGAPVPRAASLPLGVNDPVSVDGYFGAYRVTESGVLATFSLDTPNKPLPGARGLGYHLGGLAVNPEGGLSVNSAGQLEPTDWQFRTSYSTPTTYQGNFPTNGMWDAGNGVQIGGKFCQALGRSIFWKYEGEFWKNKQTNILNHFWDCGLMVGQAGTANRADNPLPSAPYGLSSGGGSGTMVKVGQDYYLYHCDEGMHAGTHRLRISNLASIVELSGRLTLDTVPAPTVVDLHEGLPKNTRLSDGVAGWFVFPANDVAGREYPQWQFGTGYYETDGLDVSARFRPSPGSPLVVRDAWFGRVLPTFAGGPWEVAADAIRFLLGGQDQDEDFNKVQVLDLDGNILVEVSRRYAGDNLELLINKQVVTSISSRAWVPLMYDYPAMKIGKDSQNRLYVDYAGVPRYYPPTTAEAGANSSKPAAIRAKFYTAGAREYGTGFVNLSFFPALSAN